MSYTDVATQVVDNFFAVQDDNPNFATEVAEFLRVCAGEQFPATQRFLETLADRIERSGGSVL